MLDLSIEQREVDRLSDHLAQLPDKFRIHDPDAVMVFKLPDDLRTWRKSHNEPWDDRVLCRESAEAIVGLGKSGYSKQLHGTRSLSRQTRLLMLAYNLMGDQQRSQFLKLALGGPL